MGSGCYNNSSSKSKGCFSIVSSDCTKWAGEENESLEICNNDTLTEVVTAIISKLANVEDGTGIILNIQNVCSEIANKLVGNPYTLVNIVQALSEVICFISNTVTEIQEEIDKPESYSLVCLTGDSFLYSREATISKIIAQLCELKDSVASLVTELNNNDLETTVNNLIGNYLINNISSCGNQGIQKTGSGESAKIKFTAFQPYYCPQPYIGPLSWFSSTGVGLEQYGMCGWYIMNGLNGTQNWMGYTFSGATVLPGIQSTNLDARVAGVGDGANVGDKKGEVKHPLITGELPAHFHKVTDKEHMHTFTGKVVQKSGSGSLITAVDNYLDVNPAPGTISYNNKIANSFTGITQTESEGNGFPHENRQPTVYGVWIVRLP